MVRGNELAEIATVAAPLYAKFGLQNARGDGLPRRRTEYQGDTSSRTSAKRSAAPALALRVPRSYPRVEASPISKPGAEGIGVPQP